MRERVKVVIVKDVKAGEPRPPQKRLQKKHFQSRAAFTLEHNTILSSAAGVLMHKEGNQCLSKPTPPFPSHQFWYIWLRLRWRTNPRFETSLQTSGTL